jgi:hypothetical protein
MARTDPSVPDIGNNLIGPIGVFVSVTANVNGYEGISLVFSARVPASA